MSYTVEVMNKEGWQSIQVEVASRFEAIELCKFVNARDVALGIANPPPVRARKEQ